MNASISMSEKIDKIWNGLKPTGFYQKMQIGYLYFSFFQVTVVVLSFVLIGYAPEFTCNRLHEPLSQYGIPILQGNSSDYLLNYGKCEITVQKNTTNDTIQTKHTLPCQEGFAFDKSEGASIISEWNLVCEMSGVGELGQTVVMAGQIFGATLFTSLADRYERKPVFVSTHLTLFIMCIALSFVPTFTSFAVLRFVSGALQQGMALALTIMALEIVPYKYRGMVGAISQFAFSGNVVLLSGIGYIMRKFSWRYLQLATALTSFHAIASYWIVDESLRWLIANKRQEEAIRVIRKATRLNNVSRDDLAEIMTMLNVQVLSNKSYLFWLVYDINFLSWKGNRHLNFFLNGLVEIPGGVLYIILIDRIGRKRSSILLHAVTGLSLIVSVVILDVVAEDSPFVVLSTILNYVGKLGISASFALLFVYTPELYPTNLRNVGLGVSSAAARVGGVFSSFSNLFASYVMWGPGVVFGTCCVLVSLLSLTLPETCCKELPQTIEEYNNWVKDRPVHRTKRVY